MTTPINLTELHQAIEGTNGYWANSPVESLLALIDTAEAAIALFDTNQP
jgi:hypothetical protein